MVATTPTSSCPVIGLHTADRSRTRTTALFVAERHGSCSIEIQRVQQPPPAASANYGHSVDDRTVTTGELAKALGVSRGAILKWQRAKLISPEFITPGKHARWNIENV